MLVSQFIAMAAAVGMLASPAPTSAPAEGDLIAIEVLLQPDSSMLAEAAKWNALMREQIPQGFQLDEEHAPHVSLLQCYVSVGDLDAVLAAVTQVAASFSLEEMRMNATGLYHIPAGNIGLAGIVIEPSSDLVALQAAAIAAVSPFAQTGGDQSAFVPDATGAAFDPLLFKYVDTFVPRQTGQNFNPHVTIGIAPVEWLQDLEKRPFKEFSFKASGIATYQLGNFGTASKRLDRGN
jgi:hypothetical protein